MTFHFFDVLPSGIENSKKVKEKKKKKENRGGIFLYNSTSQLFETLLRV